MPRFVLLHHDCPTDVPRPTHWDLMLEHGGALRTWVLDKLPEAWRDGTQPIASGQKAEPGPELFSLSAEEIQPHRIEYLTLAGPLSGGRGSVARIDSGGYDLLALSARRVSARLFGRRLRGRLELVRPHADTPIWRLNFSAAGTETG